MQYCSKLFAGKMLETLLLQKNQQRVDRQQTVPLAINAYTQITTCQISEKALA